MVDLSSSGMLGKKKKSENKLSMELRQRKRQHCLLLHCYWQVLLMGNLQVRNLQDIYSSVQNADSESMGE